MPSRQKAACAICLEDLVSSNIASNPPMILACGHTYHKTCLKNQLAARRSRYSVACACCRKAVHIDPFSTLTGQLPVNYALIPSSDAEEEEEEDDDGNESVRASPTSPQPRAGTEFGLSPRPASAAPTPRASAVIASRAIGLGFTGVLDGLCRDMSVEDVSQGNEEAVVMSKSAALRLVAAAIVARGESKVSHAQLRALASHLNDTDPVSIGILRGLTPFLVEVAGTGPSVQPSPVRLEAARLAALISSSDPDAALTLPQDILWKMLTDSSAALESSSSAADEDEGRRSAAVLREVSLTLLLEHLRQGAPPTIDAAPAGSSELRNEGPGQVGPGLIVRALLAALRDQSTPQVQSLVASILARPEVAAILMSELEAAGGQRAIAGVINMASRQAVESPRSPSLEMTLQSVVPTLVKALLNICGPGPDARIHVAGTLAITCWENLTRALLLPHNPSRAFVIGSLRQQLVLTSDARSDLTLSLAELLADRAVRLVHHDGRSGTLVDLLVAALAIAADSEDSVHMQVDALQVLAAVVRSDHVVGILSGSRARASSGTGTSAVNYAAVFLSFLRSDDDRLVVPSLKILTAMGRADAGRAAIFEAGGLQLLVTRFANDRSDTPTPSTTNTRTQAQALMMQLLQGGGEALDILFPSLGAAAAGGGEAGAPPSVSCSILVFLFSQDPEAMRRSALALCDATVAVSGAQSDREQPAVDANGAVVRNLSRITNKIVQIIGTSSAPVQTRTAVAQLLAVLAVRPESRRVIMESGQLLETLGLAIAARAPGAALSDVNEVLHALANLACSADAREVMSRSPLIANGLLAGVDSAVPRRTLRLAARAVANMTHDNVNAAGGLYLCLARPLAESVKHIARRMERAAAERTDTAADRELREDLARTRKEVVRALGNLACSASAAREIADAGAIPILAALASLAPVEQ